MNEGELVLVLGFEGGVVRVCRTPTETGGWQFQVVSRSMDLDENNDEFWRSWRARPFSSVDEALRSVVQDGTWVLLCPITVHPEYRTTMWQLAQDAACILAGEARALWDLRIHDWRGECQHKKA